MKTIITLAIGMIFSYFSFGAELFLKVNKNGNYTVSVFNQSQKNGNKVYRFFALPNGVNTIMVVNNQTNSVLYSGTLSLQQNQRVIATINAYGNLSIIKTMYVQPINWYTSIVQNTPNPYNPPIYNPNPSNPYPYPPTDPNCQYPGTMNGVDQQTFSLFMQELKFESFDSNRLKMASNYASNNHLKAKQIAQIARTFSFDSSRLSFAKKAFTNCIDKQNYFQLRSTFSFSSSYNDLLDYIN